MYILEWAVIKFNRFGRRQERIFGIDGEYCYNIVRERKDSRKMYVKTKRPIQSVLKAYICKDDFDDPTRFRVTWDNTDGSEPYEIEYTCQIDTDADNSEAAADAQEICDKLNYIIERM